MSGKLDFRREFPTYYEAEPEPHLERFGAVRYLAIDGQGPPGGPAFQSAVGDLFAVTYGAKMQAKQHGADFTVPALEAQWWTGSGRPLGKAPQSQWRWRLMLRIPPTLRRAEVAKAAAAAAAKGHAGAKDVGLLRLDEGDCVQALHVGPYDKEAPTLRRLAKFAQGVGLRPAGPHHEIYLNDPRRVAPSKVRTVLRWPVAAA